MGDPHGLFDRGIACSTGTCGTEINLVEAHKWFNLAAMAGSEDAQHWRAEIAEEMSAIEIAQAQRAARAWLSTEVLTPASQAA